jgi:hypothetical protein
MDHRVGPNAEAKEKFSAFDGDRTTVVDKHPNLSATSAVLNH